MKIRNSLLLVALVLVQYATSTSIGEQISPQTTHTKPSVHLYQDSWENDQEDMEEDAESSPSEVIETHVLPETLHSAGAGDGSSVDVGGGTDGVAVQGVQRVRRRRRRRRRKRPKPVAQLSSISATSAATVAPVKSLNGLDAYYTLPRDEIRRKPFEYRDGTEEENSHLPVPVLEAEVEAEAEAEAAVYGYTRRRVPKRRRRPLKRPIDDYSSLENGDDSQANSQSQHNVNRPVQNLRPPHNTVVDDDKSTIAVTTRKPDLPKLTTIVNRNKLQPPSPSPSPPPSSSSIPPPPSTIVAPASREHDSHSPKKTATLIQEDSDISSKRRKRPAAAQKTQHENEIKDGRDAPAKQHNAVDENVVISLKPEQHSKSTESRKEFFKPRRLPLTSAILRHAKLRSSTSPATPKNDIATRSYNNNNNNNNSTVHNEIIAAEIWLTASANPTSSSNDSTIAKSNHAPESDNKRDRNNKESTTSSATFTSVHGDQSKEKPNESKIASDDKDDDDDDDDGAGAGADANVNRHDERSSPNANFQYPIITQTPLKQHVSEANLGVINSNASAFLSANDDRLAIIYVPCNQTAADNLLRNGVGVVHRTETKTEKAENAESAAASSTTRKISTTRLPSGQTYSYSQSDEPASVATTVISTLAHANHPSATIKASSGASSSLSPSPSPSTWSVITEKLDVVASTSPYAGREAKRYHHDDVAAVSKLKIEPAKDQQTPTSPIRKPYPSPILNPSFAKPFAGSSKEIVISYTSTTNSPPSLFSYHNIDSADEQISLRLRNRNSSSGNGAHRSTFDENTLISGNEALQHQHHHHHQHQHHVERKKLPLAVKSAIIISGAILALAVLGFFALLLSCKIRQAKSRMKCHRELYRDQFQSSEFRQSSRSTSPVMSKSNYNTRNFTNNMQSNATASNRNYYLWQTLRKTFQYD